MKKKILFVLNQMGAGGVAKSLSNLLFHLEKYKDDYEVDLFLLRKEGCYINDVPSYVNVMESKGILKLFGSSQRETKKFGFFPYLSRMVIACWTKIFGNALPLKIGAQQNKLSTEYDAAISFSHTQGGRDMAAGSVEFVLNGVNAKKKFMVIHGDVVIENLLTKSTIKNMKKFDKAFSVSSSCSNQVKTTCPELTEVSDYLYNTQRNDIIVNNASVGENPYNTNALNLVMVSRLENQKAHLRFLPIVKKLHDEGFKFVLNIVGDGVLRDQINEYLLSNSMNEYVVMHGSKSNPFPYMKHADLFVLVSYYEAAPMVYNESQLVGTPVFTSRIISADEMVGDLGFVCDNNEQDIYDKLKFVLQNPQLIQQKREGLKSFDYNNDAIIKKLLSLID